MFNGDDQFVLEVRGDSMIEDQIADGDYVIVRKQDTAQRGQIVVALTDENEATLKRWYPEANRIRLEPANSSMAPDLRERRSRARRRGGSGAQGDVNGSLICTAYWPFRVGCRPV